MKNKNDDLLGDFPSAADSGKITLINQWMNIRAADEFKRG